MSNFKYYLKSPFFISALLCAILFYAGIVPVKNINQFLPSEFLKDIECIYGTVCSNPSKSESGKTYTSKIKIKKTKTNVNGSGVEMFAKGVVGIRLPSSIVESVYPGKLYSIAKGSVLIESGEKIICTGNWSDKLGEFVVNDVSYEGHESGFWGEVAHFRAICRLVFKRLMFSWGKAGGLVLSLLSGSREYLEDGLGNSFRKAGLSHILALSGMHLSFFSALSGVFGKRFGKKIVPFFQLFGILFFVWFAGISPSLFRALLCSLISLSGKLFLCKEFDTLEVLSCSFLIHSAVFPQDLFSVAFMLSYGALFGILVASDFLNRILVPFFPEKISSSLAASSGAQVITCPISVKLFGAFAPVGIVSTVVVSPFINIFMVLSLVFISLSLMFPFLSPLFSSIMNMIYGMTSYFVRMFAKIPLIQFN